MKDARAASPRALLVYTQVEPVLNALAQLRASDAMDGIVPERLHHGMRLIFERFRHEAAASGFSAQEAEHMHYALIALVDEYAVHAAPNNREYWMRNLLQLHFYQENIAGELFFQRLDEARREQRFPAMLVFYLCLLFGFRGKYGVRGQEIALHDLIDTLRDELGRAEMLPDLPLAPKGARPAETLAHAAESHWLLWSTVAAASLAALLYLGLHIDLRVSMGQLHERINQLTGVISE